MVGVFEEWTSGLDLLEIRILELVIEAKRLGISLGDVIAAIKAEEESERQEQVPTWLRILREEEAHDEPDVWIWCRTKRKKIGGSPIVALSFAFCAMPA
jgi:hypothetical protein